MLIWKLFPVKKSKGYVNYNHILIIPHNQSAKYQTVRKPKAQMNLIKFFVR